MIPKPPNLFLRGSNLSVNFLVTNAQHQQEFMDLFKGGLEKIRQSGFFNSVTYRSMKPEEHSATTQTTGCADVTVIWGHKRRATMKQIKSQNKDYLVMERAYLGDRFSHVSLGWNGLNGNANFNIDFKKLDPTRNLKHSWYKLLKPIKPLQSPKVGVVIGQVLGDASLEEFNAAHEYDRLLSLAQKECDVVFFRNHPESNGKFEHFIINDYCDSETIEEVLEASDNIYTINSNVGVLARLAGKNILYSKGSMCDIHRKSKGQDDMSFRMEWLNKLAFCQWTKMELETGEAWKHLLNITQ